MQRPSHLPTPSWEFVDAVATKPEQYNWADKITNPVSYAKDIADQKLEDIQGAMNERAANCKDQLLSKAADIKKVAVAGIGVIVGLQAGVRFLLTLSALKDGTPMYRQTEWLITYSQTMLRLRSQMKAEFAALIDELVTTVTLLKDDIRRHCNVTLGVKAAGQFIGVAGGVLIVTGAVTGKDALVKAGSICAGVNFLAEIIAAAADWFADHARRLDTIMAQLTAAGMLTAAALLRFPDMPSMPIGDKATAEVGSQMLAKQLLDASLSDSEDDE